MALSKELSSARSLDNVRNGNLAKAYLPADARSRAFHGLGPGAKLTAAGLSEALSELDKFLVVDDYGSAECVKFAREEYNKRCCMGLGGGTIHMIVMVLFYLGIYIYISRLYKYKYLYTTRR